LRITKPAPFRYSSSRPAPSPRGTPRASEKSVPGSPRVYSPTMNETAAEDAVPAPGQVCAGLSSTQALRKNILFLFKVDESFSKRVIQALFKNSEQQRRRIEAHKQEITNSDTIDDVTDRVIVIDIGAHSIRAGWANGDAYESA